MTILSTFVGHLTTVLHESFHLILITTQDDYNYSHFIYGKKMRYGGIKFALGDKTSKEKSQDSTIANKLY